MHEYDVTLKLLLQGSAQLTMAELAGEKVVRWLNVELPKVQNPRADLLGETERGELLHIELQSSNDANMPVRMAEYCLGVYRLFGKLPNQIVLYVGDATMHMEGQLSGPNLWFAYRLVDIRNLDGNRLLESPAIGDNVIAVLTRWRDQKEAVRRIIQKIAPLQPPDRENALAQLLILSGLRKTERFIEKEARNMPILEDIMNHQVIGREFKRGELTVLRRQIERKFGTIPAWAEEQLSLRSAAQLEELAVRVLDASSLEELLNA